MIAAVVQARCSSSRLPGKVMKKILGRPMLALQLERIACSELIDKIIVATSIEEEDAAIEELCANAGVSCYRGSLDNVLDRFYQAVADCPPEHVVRLTGDCPLIDAGVIDEIIKLHLKEDNDYTSNILPPTFPDGLDVEVMKFSVLQQAWNKAELPSELEHVTPYINTRPDVFKIGNYAGEKDLSDMRWTVDEPEDFVFVSHVFDELYKENPAFRYYDVLKLLDTQPDWLKVNDKFNRNEGMLKSLAADKSYKESKNG